MNIPPHIPQIVVNAAAPRTEALAKANAMKEIIPATVRTEAAVPQKSREQDVRAPNNQTSSSTYEGIQNSPDGKIIPEDEQAQNGEQSSQQESAEQEQNENDSKSQDEQINSEQSEQASNQAKAKEAEQQQQAAEREVIQQLERRDQEVKTHELAHAAIGASYAGSPSYEYQTGPNGQKYAVGGEVSIDVSKTNDPETTIRKMQTVRAAALAPAEPSSQDRKVAAEASRNIAEARADMVSENSTLSSENTKMENDDTGLTVNIMQEGNDEVEEDSTSEAEFVKMDLAQAYNSVENQNRTAQVISSKYASSFHIKETLFNAVA